MTEEEFIELIKDIGFNRTTFAWSYRCDYSRFMLLSIIDNNCNISITNVSKFDIVDCNLFKFNFTKSNQLDFIDLIFDFLDKHRHEKLNKIKIKHYRNTVINSICGGIN
jgi:hypothetical protein